MLAEAGIVLTDSEREETFRRAGSARLHVEGEDEVVIVSEFSTRSRDESDIFTDPRIRR